VALLYNIAPPERTKKVLPIVLGRRTENIVPFGSPFAMFYLLEFLAQSGRFEFLLKVIRVKWGRMLDRGATTFWETFESPRSRCHAWSAGPTYFLSRYLLGIHPLEPGFQSFLVAPQVTLLSRAEGTMPTPSGNIDVSWHREKSSLTLTLQIPDPLRFRLRLPKNLKIISRRTSKNKLFIEGKFL
jgi:hypothetical protein